MHLRLHSVELLLTSNSEKMLRHMAAFRLLTSHAHNVAAASIINIPCRFGIRPIFESKSHNKSCDFINRTINCVTTDLF